MDNAELIHSQPSQPLVSKATSLAIIRKGYCVYLVGSLAASALCCPFLSAAFPAVINPMELENIAPQIVRIFCL
jgi:hypothetical protein